MDYYVGNYDADRVAHFLSVTFESIDQGITIYDSDLRLVAWNEKYRSFNLMPEEFVRYGASLEKAYYRLAEIGAFGEGDPIELAEFHIKSMREGPLIESEVLNSSDGRHILIKRFRLPNGGVAATFTDMSKERAAEAQLRHATKMDALGRLAGGLAHDFNNMLGIVIGNLELARERLPHPEAVNFLNTAIKAAERGGELSRRLLTFARRQPLKPVPIDPATLLNDLTPMIESLTGSKIQHAQKIAPDIWFINADPAQLENVVINLIKNAVDATEPGGRIEVCATNLSKDPEDDCFPGLGPGDYVQIEISDTGVGMTQNQIDRAFEPFFTTKEASEGTGLGLSMAHGFMKQSGGHITIASDPETGTTVRLHFPRTKLSAH